MNKRVIFITRADANNKEDLLDKKKQGDLIDLIGVVNSSQINSKDIYVIAGFPDDNFKIEKVENIKVVQDDNPTGPVSINTVLNKIKKDKDKPDAFLVCSKEVKINKKHIEKLINELGKERFLVVGYKLRIEDKKLNSELEKYYNDKNLIAYKVPWNTCAIWDYKLFDKHIKKFDEITSQNPFNPVCVCIDNVCRKTEYKGMEDGLAIAQAADKDPEVYSKLLKETLTWKVDSDEKQRHREKLARKDTVLRNFMAIRNYSVDDLKRACR